MRLVAVAEPEWIDLAPGIRGRFRHGPTEALVFARRFARTAVEMDDRADPEFHFIAGVLIWGLLEWEGVADSEGAPAPVTADNVLALLRQRWDVFDAANAGYVEGVVRMDAEKNESGPSPSGTSAAAPSSATPAATAQSAPTASTTPKPKRARRYGKSSNPAPDN